MPWIRALAQLPMPAIATRMQDLFVILKPVLLTAAGSSERLLIDAVGLVRGSAEPLENTAHGQIILQYPRQLDRAKAEGGMRGQHGADQLQREHAADQRSREPASDSHERHASGS